MKTFGFKEWKLVCDLLEGGRQTILLRKGGLSEGKRGFQWLHREFLLFPTWFHAQEEQLLLPAGWKAGRDQSPAPGAGEETVEIRLWAELVATAEISRLEAAGALRPFHAWVDEVVRERFEWGERPGLSVAVVRVWRLAKPWTLRQREAFGGCRSWLGLPAEEGLDPAWRESLARACSEERVEEAVEAVRRLG